MPRHQPMRQLREAASRPVSAGRARRRGETASTGPIRIRVLNPPEPDWERQKVRNDDSIVLEIRIGDVAFLLPGDITRAVEPEVMRAFERAPFVIVKAPHHGSAGSSSAALRRGAASRRRGVQRRPAKPVRPSREGRRRALQSGRRESLLDGGGWRGGDRYGRQAKWSRLRPGRPTGSHYDRPTANHEGHKGTKAQRTIYRCRVWRDGPEPIPAEVEEWAARDWLRDHRAPDPWPGLQGIDLVEARLRGTGRARTQVSRREKRIIVTYKRSADRRSTARSCWSRAF